MSIPLPPETHPLPPPFIHISGIPNFRDLGGWAISSSPSHSIRKGVIYRSADPGNVSRTGILSLKNLGVKKLYDLRSQNEIQRNVDAGRAGVVKWTWGCERVAVPVFKDEDYSPEGIAKRYADYCDVGDEGFVRAYTQILEHAPKSYRRILLHIAREPESPLIIHCTAGKDRTGVLCALILSLCGVEDEVVAEEYALTEKGLPDVWKERVIQHLMKLDVPALKDREAAGRMVGARAESMLATLKMIKEKCGGAENYMIEKCGLTLEDVQKIRTNLIVEEPAVYGKEKLKETL